MNVRLIFNCIIIISAIFFLTAVDGAARRKRILQASGSAQGSAPVFRVATQKDAYRIFAENGLYGIRVVHLNRHMNFADYFPKEEARSAPFPLQADDVRPAYEKGLDSHNWLFIAARTGMVRAVSNVLPEHDFQIRYPELSSDPAFVLSEGSFRGFNYDIAWDVASLRTLPVIREPVVIDVDAGYFIEGADPSATARLLRGKCPEPAMVLLIESNDEPDIPDQARADLQTFEAAWKGR